MKEFFGREDLLDSLKSLWDKRVSSLVTCRGRRRIGKSTLIEEFARQSRAQSGRLGGTVQKGSIERGTGVQVDLLLQTNRSVYIVEVKRRNEIRHGVIDEVDEKVSRIKHRRGISFKTALVYDGGLAPTIEADGYFDAIIDIRELMEGQNV